ncbi:MAG: hypothetical protein RRY21_01460, partial [Oscillospiraceae bacterium]
MSDYHSTDKKSRQKRVGKGRSRPFDNFNKNLTFDNLKKCIEVGDSIQNLAPNISMMLSDNTLKVNDIIEL